MFHIRVRRELPCGPVASFASFRQSPNVSCTIWNKSQPASLQTLARVGDSRFRNHDSYWDGAHCYWRKYDSSYSTLSLEVLIIVIMVHLSLGFCTLCYFESSWVVTQCFMNDRWQLRSCNNQVTFCREYSKIGFLS